MSNRQKTVEKIAELIREQSTQTILFHAFIAEQLGLNPTDHKALDIIIKSDEITAGQLAEVTRLTTGAITGVIDRLEKAGFVRRVFDKNDRRRVIIQFVPESEEKLLTVFKPLKKKSKSILENYNDEELAIIADFIERMIELTENVRINFGKEM